MREHKHKHTPLSSHVVKYQLVILGFSLCSPGFLLVSGYELARRLPYCTSLKNEQKQILKRIFTHSAISSVLVLLQPLDFWPFLMRSTEYAGALKRHVVYFLILWVHVFYIKCKLIKISEQFLLYSLWLKNVRLNNVIIVV